MWARRNIAHQSELVAHSRRHGECSGDRVSLLRVADKARHCRGAVARGGHREGYVGGCASGDEKVVEVIARIAVPVAAGDRIVGATGAAVRPAAGLDITGRHRLCHVIRSPAGDCEAVGSIARSRCRGNERVSAIAGLEARSAIRFFVKVDGHTAFRSVIGREAIPGQVQIFGSTDNKVAERDRAARHIAERRVGRVHFHLLIAVVDVAGHIVISVAAVSRVPLVRARHRAH